MKFYIFECYEVDEVGNADKKNVVERKTHVVVVCPL